MNPKRVCSLVMAVVLAVSCFCIQADAATFTADVTTTSEALYLLNMDTNTAVFEQNSQQKMYPASTTKIMTYIVAVENIDDLNTTRILVDEEILAQLDGTDSSMSVAQYFTGEYVTAYDLLECMMIMSGNEAALLLASYVGDGSVQAFVDMMNEKAEELGCTGTHFTNPHGLHDEDHYTTAEDLAIITSYALTLPEFSEITNMTEAYLTVDADGDYPMTTTNYLIDETRGGDYYYEYAKGVKTGTTDEAGYCLVSTATKDGYTYMCVALGAPSVDSSGNEVTDNGAMTDSKTLYEWAFSTLENKTVITEDTIICEVAIELAWDKDTVRLVPQGSYSTLLPTDVESSSIDIQTDVPDSLTAPIIQGTVVGTATISYAGNELTTVNLIAEETVERSKLLYFLDIAKQILSSQWMIISIIAVVCLIVVYVIITIIYNSMRKKRKAKK